MIFKNRWDLVLLNIIFFSSFIFLIKFNKPANWYSSGIYIAFIISLFVEMYGFPLTIYFASNYFGFSQQENFVFTISIYNQNFGLNESTIIGIIITIAGISLIIMGWKEIYKNKNKLTKTGIYRFSRHPQYLGILLIAFGWMVGWPTLLTFVFWPILLLAYFKQAKKEDKFLAKKFGKQFNNYEKSVPLFI
jgi:protein-S-isoprenylcysteine O-methyltransferase Ste14